MLNVVTSYLTTGNNMNFMGLIGDLYADSNFYKTKDSLYPTIPEQMKLCRMISGILEAPDAMRSRGGKMYLQRKDSADRYAQESMGRKLEKPYDGLDAGKRCNI